jgi:hypothetical protein
MDQINEMDQANIRLKLSSGKAVRDVEINVPIADKRAVRVWCVDDRGTKVREIKVNVRLKGSSDDFVDLMKGDYDLAAFEPGTVLNFDMEVEAESVLPEPKTLNLYIWGCKL